jgi:hypothetical protein
LVKRGYDAEFGAVSADWRRPAFYVLPFEKVTVSLRAQVPPDNRCHRRLGGPAADCRPALRGTMRLCGVARNVVISCERLSRLNSRRDLLPLSTIAADDGGTLIGTLGAVEKSLTTVQDALDCYASI